MLSFVGWDGVGVVDYTCPFGRSDQNIIWVVAILLLVWVFMVVKYVACLVLCMHVGPFIVIDISLSILSVVSTHI